MRKQIILTSALVLAAAVSGQAMAVCDGTAPYTTLVANASATFSNTTVCAVKTGGGDQWHEYHNPTGLVLEKIGDGTAVDPNVAIGTWATSAGQISYTYTGDSTYTYDKVYSNGGTGVEFCSGTTQIATGTLSGGKVLTPC